jgi:hypothetical protein
MGETRVDLQHLLEDLRDAYTGTLEETILTEIIANALDSGATRIRLLTSSADAALTIVDDGCGMRRRELARYHDVAASTKQRGDGIGFAGVGIKLGLLASREVITETRRGTKLVATRWHLASRFRAPWRWIPPLGLTGDRGTAVRLILSNQLSPLVDAGYLEETIRRHFEPLLDSAFDDLLRRHYPHGVAFEVDGRELARVDLGSATRVSIAIRLGRRRTPSVAGYVERRSPVPPDREGVAVSTFGKVIKRGWDWLGLAHAAHSQITGLIDAPDLAACLTLSKNDFIRSGARGATYLAYRKAVQEVVSRQLAEWDDRSGVDARPRVARLERDIERVLEDLAEDFPLLRPLVDRRPGGQKRLPMPGRGDEFVPAPLFADTASERVLAGESSVRTPIPCGRADPGEEPSTATPVSTLPSFPESPRPGGEAAAEPETPRTGNPQPQVLASAGSGDVVRGTRRPARYGLLVRFESRPGDSELGRLVDSTVWINDAHPAYARAVASRSVGYHTALAVGLALAPLAVEARGEHAFITQFLAHWGGAHAPGGKQTRHAKKTR